MDLPRGPAERDTDRTGRDLTLFSWPANARVALQDLFAKICDCPPAKEGVASHSAQERKASVAEVPDAPEYCDSIQYCVFGDWAIIRSKIFRARHAVVPDPRCCGASGGSGASGA